MDIFLVGRNLDLVANEIARLEFPGTARRSWNRLCCGSSGGTLAHRGAPAQQSVLVLGYRTNLRYMDPGYYGLVVMNGALGASPIPSCL